MEEPEARTRIHFLYIRTEAKENTHTQILKTKQPADKLFNGQKLSNMI